jgi:Fur family ferric uptake transcriptional regulator
MIELEQQLIDHKIRPTAMRLLTLELLRKQTTTVSLTSIENGLAPADRVTIYRTLKTFKEKGLIHTIDDGTGSPKYALCKHENHTDIHDEVHVHFFCNDCETTTCLEDSHIPFVKVPSGFDISERSLLIKGSCPHCS